MPVRRSRQGSNSATAKLITRANSSKLHLINNNNNSGDGLTAKQQQQIERNEYLEKLTKDQLKFECRKRGQKSSGTKVELLQRLGYKMPLQQLNKVVDATTSNNTNNINNKDLTKSSSNGTLSNSTRLTDKQREKLKMERKNLTLWKHPITTLKYFGLESYILLSLFGRNVLENCPVLAIGPLAFLMHDLKLTNNKPVIAFLATLCSILTVFLYIPGRHQFYFDLFRNNTFFVVYWVGLGVLSSVGLGTGLHTFILYLGPHIASVTLAAYECNSLDFPKPPYPNEIICPEHTNPNFIPSLWSIMTKVRFEAFLWGAGTALGELPPYFMARAARLSGHDQDEDEDMKEFEELQQKKAKGVKLNLFDRAKLAMERIVEKVGFLGILACASIPNPLFDLAGITCGHFLVPFWTFFGATLIGKAVIKMHIQKIFVIIAFNELLIDKAVDFLELVPIIGKKLQEPFKSFLQNQKIKLHGRNKVPSESGNMLQKIFETFVVLMVAYFLLSIVNSFAQSYHKRLHKKSQKKIGKEKDN